MTSLIPLMVRPNMVTVTEDLANDAVTSDKIEDGGVELVFRLWLEHLL